MKWMTYPQKPLEQLACAWLITRFIDSQAQILFAPEETLDSRLQETKAIPFEVEGVEFVTDAKQSAFDRILFSYRMTNPALLKLAECLRGQHREDFIEILKEAKLEKWISLLDEHFMDEEARLKKAIALFDALYEWFKKQQDLSQIWEPKTNAGKIF